MEEIFLAGENLYGRVFCWKNSMVEFSTDKIHGGGVFHGRNFSLENIPLEKFSNGMARFPEKCFYRGVFPA
jgi:hypothetical protein